MNLLDFFRERKKKETPANIAKEPMPIRPKSFCAPSFSWIEFAIKMATIRVITEKKVARE